MKGLALMKDRFRSVRKGFPVRLWRLPRQHWNILLLGLALILSGTAGLLPPLAGAVFAQGGKPSKQSSGETDVQRLVGHWVRLDGGYLLEFREVHKEGSLKAAYFKPRPIRVYQAAWTRRGEKITVLVELRDVNYPGSTYNLEYVVEGSLLPGVGEADVGHPVREIQIICAF